MRDTRETVQAFLQRVGAGDLDGAADLFAEPVDWNIPGAPELPWIGRRSTREEIKAYFPTLFGAVKAEEFSNEAIVVEGEEAVILGRFRDRVLASGVVFESPFSLRMTVRDGRIVRYHFLEDSYTVAIGCGVAKPVSA